MSLKIAILGSTGSIGTQTLDIVRQHPDKLEVLALTANNNWQLLVTQAKEFLPDAVVIANDTYYPEVSTALQDYPIKVYAGYSSISDIVENSQVDVVVSALVGFAGLAPTIRAAKASKRIALANKESLVVAGELVTRLVNENKSVLLPLDSEHSAIFQCLWGNSMRAVTRLLLTASGGPFRKVPTDQLATVTAQQALAHPTWNMGAKITIDSATMMNKGFEMIEAKWLFGVSPDNIDIVVHPESIVHSAVEFHDGVIMAQMGCPDMKMPIQLALSYPERWNLETKRLNLTELAGLSFEAPDLQKFPCIGLAYEAVRRGGSMPCVLNAANEVVNYAFRQGEISFTQIPVIVEQTMNHIAPTKPASLDDYIEVDREARAFASSLI